MSIALMGTANSDTVKEVFNVKIYKVHRADLRRKIFTCLVGVKEFSGSMFEIA